MKKFFVIILAITFLGAVGYGVVTKKEKKNLFSVFEFEKYLIDNEYLIPLTEEQLKDYNDSAIKALELYASDWENQNINVPLINSKTPGSYNYLPKRGYIVDDEKVLSSFFTPKKYKNFIYEKIGKGGVTIVCSNSFFINYSVIKNEVKKSLKDHESIDESIFSYLSMAMINETAHLYIGAYLPEAFGKLTYMSEDAIKALLEASQYFAEGNYEVSIKKFKTVRKKCPALANAIDLSALSNRRLKNYDESSRLYKLSIQLREKELPPHQNLVLNYFESENYAGMNHAIENMKHYLGDIPQYYYWKSIYIINSGDNLTKKSHVYELLKSSADKHYENNNSLGIQSDLVLIGKVIDDNVSSSSFNIEKFLEMDVFISALKRIKLFCMGKDQNTKAYGDVCDLNDLQSIIDRSMKTYYSFYNSN